MSRHDVLVTTDRAENVGADGIAFLEFDEDAAAYAGDHLPRAFEIDLTTERPDPAGRDIVQEQFEPLLSGLKSPTALSTGRRRRAVPGALRLHPVLLAVVSDTVVGTADSHADADERGSGALNTETDGLMRPARGRSLTAMRTAP